MSVMLGMLGMRYCKISFQFESFRKLKFSILRHVSIMRKVLLTCAKWKFYGLQKVIVRNAFHGFCMPSSSSSTLFAYIGNTLGIFESSEQLVCAAFGDSTLTCTLWDGDMNDIKLKGFSQTPPARGGELKNFFFHIYPRKFILGPLISLSMFAPTKNPCPLSNFNLYSDLIFFSMLHWH